MPTTPVVRQWTVIEVWKSDLPVDISTGLSRDAYVCTFMWDDIMVYHGEDGWVLEDDDDEEDSEAVQALEALRISAGLDERMPFYVRIKST